MRIIAGLLTLALIGALVVTATFALLPGSDGGQGGSFWHWTAFVTLGLLTRLAMSRRHPALLWLGLGAFGGAIEIVQGLIHTGRDMDLGDFVTDLAAAAIGLAIGQVVLFIYRRATRAGAPSGNRSRPEASES